MVRQYIGARYTPKFMGLFDPTTEYENLCVVDNGAGTTYISNKIVPPNTPLTNTEYWTVYGSSSGAILNLQQQIGGLGDLDTQYKDNLVGAINEVNGEYESLIDRIETLEMPFYIMKPTGDSTDRKTDLVTALTNYKAILFTAGEFYFSGNIDVPNNTLLIGCGKSSKIIGTHVAGSIFNFGNNVSIENLYFDGGLSSTPEGITDKNGIVITNTGKTCTITNCTFNGFPGRGIYVHANGGSTIGSANVVNCMFIYNGIGVHAGEYGEYGLYSNNTFYRNFVGANLTGGNNRCVGCNFGNNTTALVIDGLNIANSGHGQVIGCSFNHNTDGIKIHNTSNGFDIIGCLFYINDVYDIQAGNVTGGFNIDSCNFGTGAAVDTAGCDAFCRNNTFTTEPSLNFTAPRTKGFGNVYGAGIPVVGWNRYLHLTSSDTITKTYTSNTSMTEAEFNKILVYRNGALAYIRFNSNLAAVSGDDWVTIGHIDASFLTDDFRDVFDNNHHVLVQIKANGDIQVYKYDSNAILVRYSTVIPLANTQP